MWTPVGQAATVAQLIGLDAISIITMIVKAAERSRTHKKNCEEISRYVALIGDLLVPLNISELKMYPETRAPLERLEEALRRCYILVDNCQNHGFLYFFAMGWKVEKKFWETELEIERYLKLIPLITLVDLKRVREIRGERTERDQPEHVPNEVDNNLNDGSSSSGVEGLDRQRRRTRIRTVIRNLTGSVKDALASFKSRNNTEAKLGVQRVFTLTELRRATRDFADDNIIGRGEFTVIYKGTYNGIPFAVKRWRLRSMQGPQEWENEMNILSTLSHPNLIKLLGYCKEEDQILLVYEFMDNGSLEHLLHHGTEPLSWEKRIKIASGTAKALQFLHTHENHIIHRGIKPSVILLDSDFNPKLSGLGWSRDGPDGEEAHCTTQVLGTPGYLDPRYIMTGHLDAKTDVYAFGIVLLQVLSGRKVFDTRRERRNRHLVQLAGDVLKAKQGILRLMDPQLDGKYPLRAASRLAKLGLSCTSSDGEIRPTMELVRKVIEKFERSA